FSLRRGCGSGSVRVCFRALWRAGFVRIALSRRLRGHSGGYNDQRRKGQGQRYESSFHLKETSVGFSVVRASNGARVIKGRSSAASSHLRTAAQARQIIPASVRGKHQTAAQLTLPEPLDRLSEALAHFVQLFSQLADLIANEPIRNPVRNR